MKEIKLAVTGKDVSKSQSPEMHAFIAERLGYKVSYDKISIEEDKFKNNVLRLFEEYDGFNVTIPYKLSVIPYLSEVLGDAKIFGAVNTVTCKNRRGYNTDGLGFALMLKLNGVDVRNKNALVLGAGGAGRSIAKKLADSFAKVDIYDRFYESAKAVAAEFSGVNALEKLQDKSYFLIVNATGVGMHKSVGISPVDESVLKNSTVAVDLIYTPPKSKFLEIAESLNKKIINGAAMLFYQAYYSECIYAGISPDDGVAKRLFDEYTAEGKL